MTSANLSFELVANVCAWFAAGVSVGACHFLTLRWNVTAFLAGRSILLPCAIQFIRLALIGVALTAIARWSGAIPLLSTILGIVLARTVIVRRGLLA